MDAQRFDALTRVLAGGLPRRGALKTLAGIALAGTATRAVIDDAKACLSDGVGPCESRSECCAGLGCFKRNGGDCQPCSALNTRCNDSNECCAELTCNKHNNCTKGEGGGKVKCNGKDCDKKKGKGKGKGKKGKGKKKPHGGGSTDCHSTGCPAGYTCEDDGSCTLDDDGSCSGDFDCADGEYCGVFGECIPR